MSCNDKCNNAFEDYLVKCSTEINVFAKLEPNTLYNWVITDKFDRQYSGDFTTDANGFWQIDIDDLPEGLLTEFSGIFKLEVYEYSVYPTVGCSPIKFKIAQEYDNIIFCLRAGTREKNNLGCEF